VPGAAVHAVVEEHFREAKKLAFKKKRRKGYQRLKGHRQVRRVERRRKRAPPCPPKKPAPSSSRRHLLVALRLAFRRPTDSPLSFF
jgi:hypothetical protein